jgi:hypothetical protein
MSAGALLLASLAMQGTGTALGVQGARHAAKSEEAIHKYNAQVNLQAAAEERRASLEEQLIRRKAATRTVKSMRAGYAKSGVQVEGSPMLNMLESVEAMASDIDILAQERSTRVRRLTSEAGVNLARAKIAGKTGKFNVLSSLFSGVGQMASTGLNYKLLKEG